MKFCKKTLSFILAFVLLFSSITPVSAKNDATPKKTTIDGQEIVIGDKVYYIFSTDKNAKEDLIKAQEKGEKQLEELQASDGLEISGNLHQASVGAGQPIPYTLKIDNTNFKGVGGKSFDWATLPDGLELQVWYLDEEGLDVNVGNPIEINSSNYKEVITRTFEISGQPIAFGVKTNVDTDTYLTDAYLTEEPSVESRAGSLEMAFKLVQVPSTKLDVKWVDANRQPLTKDKPTATSLKEKLTFNFIENRKFDLPNQDKEDPYFRLVNMIDRRTIKDMDGATPLVGEKKDGEEVTLDGKIYKLSTSYDPAFNKGSKIQLMFMPDVIDRTNNPEAETPENYVRVTIDAGEGTKLAEGQKKKVYDVRVGKVLKAEHYPKLELKEGHKDPITWTIAPGTAINKKEDIKGNAEKTAAETITKDNLKAVDTTALQGQDLDEKFWHKGVELKNADADLQKLLDEATVTDLGKDGTKAEPKDKRTTDKDGTFEGTLLVTFKDGSTLEVEKQKLIVKPNTVTVEFDKAEGKEHPLRDGDTTVKGKISASSNSTEFPVSLDGAVVTIKKGDKVLSRTLANKDGSFVAGVKDPLVAGEDISVVVTLPESKTESAPVTEKVQLNPDKLNEIIPTGNEVVKNLKGKKGVDQTKVAKLEEALDAADKLVDKKGKVLDSVPVTDKGQASLNTAYENIKKAIEALTGNTAPEVKGTSHKEIFKGDALNLEDGITVKDADGENDIVLQGGKKFSYTVEKIGDKGAKTPVTDTTTINQTAGTYEVTYTAKDKSGAEGKFVMTLVVKEPVVEIKEHFPEVIPEGYVKVEFKEGKHGKLTGTTKFLVKDGSAKNILNAPTVTPNDNWEVNEKNPWEPAIPDTFTGTEENNKSFVFTAQYTYTGPDVVEEEPGKGKPDVPDNFVKVEFKKGDHGIISSEYTTIYWVNPDKNKTLKDIKKPEVTALEGYKFTGWDKEDTTAIGKEGLTVTAQYKAKVVEEEPKIDDPKKPGEKITDPDYVKLTFNNGDNGEFAENAKTEIWVLKNEEVKFNAPQVKANDGFAFNGWEPILQTKYDKDETHTAKYEPTSDISDKPVKGFQEVKFMAGTDGNFGKDGETPITTKSVWVRPGVEVDLTLKAPKVIANKGKVHSGWEPSLKGTFAKSKKATEITAQYKTDADNNGIADEDEQTPDPDVIARNIGKDPKVTTVEVETEKNADVTIEYKDANGDTKTITGKADDQGKLTKEITPKLDKGTPVKVTVKDGEKKPTSKTVKVFDDLDNNKIPDDQAGQTERPAAIASNKGKNPAFTTIEGKTEKGAVITVTIKVNGEEKPVTVENLKVNDDGTYTLEAKYDNKPLENGAEILVYAENAPKTKSAPQTTTVFNDFNNDGKPDGGKVDLDKISDIQVIDPNKMTYVEGTDGSLDLTGLKVVVRDTVGGIEVFEYDTKANKFKDGDAALDGFTVKVDSTTVAQGTTLTSADHNNKKITVAYGQESGETVQALKVTKTLPAPEVDDVKKDDTTVKVTVPTNGETKITVKVGDKEAVAEKDPKDGQWKVGNDPIDTVKGKLEIPVDPLKQGDVVKVTTEDPAGNKGEAEKQVPVDEYSKEPTELKAKNEPATPDKTTITGKATPGAVITITDKAGKVLTTDPAEVKADGEGNFKATIDKKDPDTLLLVKAKEEGKEPSADVPVQVEGSQDVVEKKPGVDKTEGFVEVRFVINDADKTKGTLEGATAYYVNPKVFVTLNPPVVKPATGYKLDGWDKKDQMTIPAKKYTQADATETDTTDGSKYVKITAIFAQVPDTVPAVDPDTGKENEKPEGYVEVKFALDTSKAEFGEKAVTKYFVNPTKDIELTAPEVNVIDKAYAFQGWDNKNWNSTDNKFNKAKYTEDTTITAKLTGSTVAKPEVDDVVTGDTTVKVKPGDADKVTVEVEGQGTIEVTKNPETGKWETPDHKEITPDKDGKLPVPVQPIGEKALVEVTVEKDGVVSEKVAKTAQKVLVVVATSLKLNDEGITVKTLPAGAKVTIRKGGVVVGEGYTGALGSITIGIKDSNGNAISIKEGDSFEITAEMDGYITKVIAAGLQKINN